MIKKKRQSLECFLKEQTLGPGATGFRFIDLNDKNLVIGDKAPLDYDRELINIIPAGVYSTGILFPIDESCKGGKSDDTEQQDEGASGENTAELGAEPDTEDDLEEENVSADSQSINQMYPNSMGLTVCLNKHVAIENDLEIIISGRYYRKINFKKDSSSQIGVVLEQEKSIFNSFLASLPDDDIVKISIALGETEKGITYIRFKGDYQLVANIKASYYELFRQQFALLKVGENPKYTSFSSLKEGLYSEIRYNIPPDTDEGSRVIEKLKKIEVFENSMSHILDLINMYDASGYGVWKCETFQKKVGDLLPIPKEINGKFVYSHKNEKSLSNVQRTEYAKEKWASLAVNIQYSTHMREELLEDRVFLKVQLLNTSKHFSDADTKKGKNYFSLASEEVNKRCFFGVAIEVRSKHLVPYRSLRLNTGGIYTEEEINRYIYRQFKDFGIGHGCSVKWQAGDVPSVSTEYVPSQETPDVDPIPRARNLFAPKDGKFIPKPIFSDTSTLQFKWLSTLSNVKDWEIVEGLKAFVLAYRNWITNQDDKKYLDIANQIKEECKRDQERMLKNIELLSDRENLLCFRLMNTAMFMQLWHGEQVKKNKLDAFITEEAFDGFFESFYKNADDKLYVKDEHAAWRPFQLAFILLNLDGVFQGNDTEWKARNEWVDLVWFPTGGGKTEAYLGLIAITIINRRKKFKEKGGGVAVLMRYTLRLLTTQQFQRATLLIMALELMRRWKSDEFGEEPIYIGLFVGGDSLPNKLKGDYNKPGLLEEYSALEANQRAGRNGKSRIPLNKCPWCGHPLNPIQFFYERLGTFTFNRILLGCSRKDKKCAFSLHDPLPARRGDQGPIPVSLCDEEIYQHPPALLFGTVDKFAQIAHKISDKEANRHADSRRLFGKGNWEKGKPINGYLPPDLIIQDELHLMMGPLGSAVALFESAIDQLCTLEIHGKKIRPKVISSTATTRNTSLQIMALFDRKVNIFPKPGINCDDSFFAFYKRSAQDEQGSQVAYISKRKYIGILPTGRTQMWMQLRLAAILFTHRAVFEKKELGTKYPMDSSAYSSSLTKAMDYYHTVLSYFNSLREVGKTESQIYTYLLKEIRKVFNKVVRHDKLMHCLYTYTSSFHNGELTGRLSGEAVVNQLERISTSWQFDKRFAHLNSNGKTRGATPPDWVIATNMISVGIDIARFNTMIINCMPRNIAEYIQASSRVARDMEGLVITIHHPFRSRDISHYEHFVEFHEKMYSYVEPISITPFTRKALERYLPLYLATIIRHKTTFVERTDANRSIGDTEKTRLIKYLMSYFEKRKEHLWKMTDIEDIVKRLLTDENLLNIQQLVEAAIEAWKKEYGIAANANEDLVFNYIASRSKRQQRQLYVDIDEYQDNIHSALWRIPQSLRVVEPEAVIHVNQK